MNGGFVPVGFSLYVHFRCLRDMAKGPYRVWRDLAEGPSISRTKEYERRWGIRANTTANDEEIGRVYFGRGKQGRSQANQPLEDNL